MITIEVLIVVAIVFLVIGIVLIFIGLCQVAYEIKKLKGLVKQKDEEIRNLKRSIENE